MWGFFRVPFFPRVSSRCEDRSALGSKLFVREAGQGLTEYIIIVVVVAILVLIGIRYFGSSIGNQFSGARDEISSLGNESQEIEGENSSASHATSAGPGAGSSSNRTSSLNSSGTSEEDGLSSNSASSSGNKDEIESLKEAPVGQDPSAGIPELSWGQILQFGGLVVLVGILVVFLGAKKGDKKKEKKEKKKKKLQKKDSAESGQAMVEFVFVAITFLFTILGVIQLAMILNAYALTRYAAYNAARAGVVYGGNEDKMKEAARLSLISIFPRHGRADHLLGMTENYLAAKATDDDDNYYDYTVRINGSDVHRTKKITEVKIIDNRGVGSGEVVTFDDPKQAPKGLITVEVTHQYQMVIPLVNRILFWVYNRFLSQKEGGSGGYAGESLMNLSKETDKLRRSGGLGGEFRYPLTAHYTMRLQSDYEKP